MPPKVEIFTLTQVRGLMKLLYEETMICFNGAIDRMEKKITTLVEENVLVKKELAVLKESVQFLSEMFKEKQKESRKTLMVAKNTQ